MSELNIPDGAYKAAMNQVPVGNGDVDRLAAEALIAGAPHVVAAELRRIADDVVRVSDEWMAQSNAEPSRPRSELLLGKALGTSQVVHLLRARADELGGVS